MWQDPPSLTSEMHKWKLEGRLVGIENIAKLNISKANMHITLSVVFLHWNNTRAINVTKSPPKSVSRRNAHKAWHTTPGVGGAVWCHEKPQATKHKRAWGFFPRLEMCLECLLGARCILGSDPDPLTLSNNKRSLYSAPLKTELTKYFAEKKQTAGLNRRTAATLKHRYKVCPSGEFKKRLTAPG